MVQVATVLEVVIVKDHLVKDPLGQIFGLTGWREIMDRGSWEVDASMRLLWLKHG